MPRYNLDLRGIALDLDEHSQRLDQELDAP